jgi:hypothetical protein
MRLVTSRTNQVSRSRLPLLLLLLCLFSFVTSSQYSFPPGLITSGLTCASSASPAVCSTAPLGAVAIPTGVNSTLVVNTTAVTAASTILLTSDDSVTIAATTCNSTLATLAGGMAVTARTPGVSFTIAFNGTITTNPLCVGYQIRN